MEKPKETTEPTPNIEPQTVAVLQRKGAAALVAYDADGKPARKIVKVTDLTYTDTAAGKQKKQALIPAHLLDQGIDYGFAWRDALTAVTVTPEDVELALHQNGIWTLEDAKANPATVRGAVQGTLADLFTMIAHAVKHQEPSTKE